MNEKLMTEMKSKRDLLRSEDKSLRAMFDEAKSNGATNEDLSKVVAHIKDVDNQFLEVDSDIKQYGAAFKELGNSEDFKKFETELASKYGVEIIAEKLPEDKKEENKAEEKTTVNNKKHTATKVIAGVLALAAAAGLGYGLRGCSASKTSDDTAIYQSEDEDETKEPGSYGTFLDASNQEQVEQRANYIYENYYKSFAGQLTQAEQELVTPENIANIIRVMNGELPLDSEGNVIYNSNLTDDYVGSFVKITADLPSSPELDAIYNVPCYMFAEDGSKTSDFIKPYDEDYKAIAEARNDRDGTKAREAIASLGTKMWNEWVLQGMYGDSSPYDLPASERTLAYTATMAKYGPYAFEYDLNAMQPVCINACIDYSSKTMKELTVNEIYVGYTSGEWDTVLAKAAGIEVDNKPDSIDFDKDLSDELEFKYEQIQQKTLK